MKFQISFFTLSLCAIFLSYCSSGPGKEGSPPRTTDELKIFADLYWRQKCAVCHGLTGTPSSETNPAPRKFGTFGMKMGFFFGGDKMRAGIFRTVRDGKNQVMPAFGKDLSEEKIWALVEKIERLPH
ncbi:cytochrome c [Leptospira fluminis]|uniref:Cytochrome c n=1 Tax=Leptospira fluminis TaxID=2484979 RepID=A0A4R9GNL6_9LEPT|nr:cytochrome c [Leptospira fluminis]TGK18049.1 cytochrome c [Leptospira fluminis]